MSRAVALSFYTIITGFPVLTFKTASVSLHLEASLPLPRNHSINGVEFPPVIKAKKSNCSWEGLCLELL